MILCCFKGCTLPATFPNFPCFLEIPVEGFPDFLLIPSRFQWSSNQDFWKSFCGSSQIFRTLIKNCASSWTDHEPETYEMFRSPSLSRNRASIPERELLWCHARRFLYIEFWKRFHVSRAGGRGAARPASAELPYSPLPPIWAPWLMEEWRNYPTKGKCLNGMSTPAPGSSRAKTETWRSKQKHIHGHISLWQALALHWSMCPTLPHSCDCVYTHSVSNNGDIPSVLKSRLSRRKNVTHTEWITLLLSTVHQKHNLQTIPTAFFISLDWWTDCSICLLHTTALNVQTYVPLTRRPCCLLYGNTESPFQMAPYSLHRALLSLRGRAKSSALSRE